jgi:hypothetical protein
MSHLVNFPRLEETENFLPPFMQENVVAFALWEGMLSKNGVLCGDDGTEGV